MNKKAQEILDFWFKETPSEKRFKKDESFDQLIREKFLKDYELASANEYDDWQDRSLGCLALVILFDQFSRSIYRNDILKIKNNDKPSTPTKYSSPIASTQRYLSIN